MKFLWSSRHIVSISLVFSMLFLLIFVFWLFFLYLFFHVLFVAAVLIYGE